MVLEFITITMTQINLNEHKNKQMCKLPISDQCTTFAEPKDIVFVGLSQPNAYHKGRAEVFRQHLEEQFKDLKYVSLYRYVHHKQL